MTMASALQRLKVVDHWLAARRLEWERRLDRFDHYVKHLQQKESAS